MCIAYNNSVAMLDDDIGILQRHDSWMTELSAVLIISLYNITLSYFDFVIICISIVILYIKLAFAAFIE